MRLNYCMELEQMQQKQLDFLVGALPSLHISIGRAMIDAGKDLSVEQLDLIKNIISDVGQKSVEYANN
jgi:hypothetical protein